MIPIQHSNYLLWPLSRERKTYVHAKTWLPTSIAALFVKFQSWKQPALSPKPWVNCLQKVKQPHHGILLSNKEEWNIETYNLEVNVTRYQTRYRQDAPPPKWEVFFFFYFLLRDCRNFVLILLSCLVEPSNETLWAWRFLGDCCGGISLVNAAQHLASLGGEGSPGWLRGLNGYPVPVLGSAWWCQSDSCLIQGRSEPTWVTFGYCVGLSCRLPSSVGWWVFSALPIVLRLLVLGSLTSSPSSYHLSSGRFFLDCWLAEAVLIRKTWKLWI